MNAIRSGLIWAAVALLVAIWLPLVAAVRLFDRDPARYATGRMFRRLGVAFTWLNPFWQFDIGGHFPENPRRPYVVVANHQSLADIPVISRLPWEMKWVAKAELFKLPVAGWMLKLVGDIPVERGDRGSRGEALQRARATLDNRCSVMFFSEGTRSTDARVRRFQLGAFHLAIESGVPVLPIAIDGTSEGIPKHGWKFQHKIVARVEVLDPIPTEGLSTRDAATLAEDVRQRIIGQIAAWRGASPADIDALKQRPGQGRAPRAR
jgi:1-acyl-sn-glycerol-3-phosphate acyltransferase